MNTIMIKKMRLITLTILFVSVSCRVFSQGLNPVISILPGTNVDVGEEVFFRADSTTYQGDGTLLRKARYEWDFGDGYSFRFGFPYYYTACSGLACVHYFMQPGTFNVRLIVSVYTDFIGEGNPAGPPIAKDSVTVLVTVMGEAPMTGFELLHAPFHVRLAQYLYAVIPPSCQGNQTTLRVMLAGPGEDTTTLFSKSGLTAEEKILLDQKQLAQGDYVVIAELLDAGGQRLPGGIWRDKFSKQYAGVPRVGIDENNAVRVNGQFFFPIMTYMTDNEHVQSYLDSSSINSLHTEGWYPSHNVTTWTDYLNRAAVKGLMCIGPTRGDYDWGEVEPRRQEFNHDINRMAEYIRANRDNPALLMWSWEDEPNLGGWPQKAYQPVLAAWQYVCHREDPQHPHYNGLACYDWSKYYGTDMRLYDYIQSDKFFGGKKWTEDIIGGDIYPIQYRLHPTLNFADMGPYSAYLDALDRMQTNNRRLVPCFPALQVCEETEGDNTPPITAEQVYLEAWMNVIHGAKGILWFPFFVYSTIRWSAMNTFANQMEVLAPVVLGPAPSRTVSNDANDPLKRVDMLIRESGTDVYIFAARVTEPDPITGANYSGIEPELIQVNVSVSSLAGTMEAQAIDESRTIPVVNGQFQDTFGKNAVHIYRINTVPTGISGNSDNIPSEYTLGQNYPNPFNPSTTIRFGLPVASFVTLRIFDVVGREVTTIVSEELQAGYFSRQWNAEGIPSGIYFYRLSALSTASTGYRSMESGSFTKTMKLIVVK
jgi:hypothetical protein